MSLPAASAALLVCASSLRPPLALYTIYHVVHVHYMNSYDVP